MNDILQDTRDQLFDQVLAEGVVVHWVTSHPDSPAHRGLPWAYTVGRTLDTLPELLVTGLDEERSKALLVELNNYRAHPDHACLTETVGTVSFIRAETGLLFGAYALFGPKFEALQVIWRGDGEQPIHAMGTTVLTDPYPEG